MREASGWPLFALLPTLFGLRFALVVWRHCKAIMFPIIGKYGCRCPMCRRESDCRGMPLTAEMLAAVQYEPKWSWVALVFPCVLPWITVVMCHSLLPTTVKAADEIEELAQSLSPRFAPTATDINNARDEVRAKLVLYEHHVQHVPGVYSLGIEFENLSISHYARIEFNAIDPKVELRDDSNKLVRQLPVVRTGPAPANQIAIVPPGSFVTFSTIYPGSGMNGAVGQVTCGNHTWRVVAGRYRLRGTVPVRVSLAKGDFQEARPPSRYLPPSEWPMDAGQIDLKLPVVEFSVPKRALP